MPLTAAIAFFTCLTVPRPPRVLTTYESFGPSVDTAAVGCASMGAAEAAPVGRKPSEAVSANPTGNVSARVRLDPR